MLSEGNKNKYLSQLLRYSLWAVGLFGVFGIAIYFGSSLSAYNNQAPPWLPCVWEYDEDTTLEVPYRYDPISNDRTMSICSALRDVQWPCETSTEPAIDAMG